MNEHKIRYQRPEPGYRSPWIATCTCGWQSQPHNKFQTAQSAAQEHRDTTSQPATEQTT